MLTKEQKNMLNYVEDLKNSLTQEQLQAKEDKEIEQSKKRLHRKIKLRVKNQPRMICLANREKIWEENMTEEMKDKEIEFWFTN